MSIPCQLPYPEKYYRALAFYKDWPSNARKAEQDTQLLLYALSQQAAYGRCTELQPSSWDATAYAKWQAWNGLKEMDKVEAMRLFVKTLEEDEPNWYSFGVGVEQEVNDEEQPSSSRGLRSLPADDVWRSPWVVAEKHPHPRFEHSCCLIGSNMYLFGGNTSGGRYLSDVWQLNLETLAWTNVTGTFASDTGSTASVDPSIDLEKSTFPACAAMVALPHRGRALIIGGHTKAQKENPTAPLTVRVLDPARNTFGVLRCTGAVPPARGSHAAAIIGDKAYVFGGEGARLRLQQGVQVLDLMTNEWSELEISDPKNSPEPRTALAGTAYQDRYFIIFGGGAVGRCHNDIWVLDTLTAKWEQPPVTGPKPSPRAGCTSALLGNTWYILGGGNNSSGCPDMYMLSLVKLGVAELAWERVATFDKRAALASEGASIVAASAYGALVAFGGYNGVYHNSVSAFKPTVQTNGHVHSPDAAASPLTDRVSNIVSEIQPADGSPPRSNGYLAKESDKEDVVHKTATLLLEEAAQAKEAMQEELALTRNELEELQRTHAESEAEIKSLQAALAAEKDKSMRLDVERSELEAKLQHMDEIERECRKYKDILAEREKKAGGVWGFISGA